MKILNILGSSRKNGNSEYLTDQMLQDVAYKKLFLHDYHIKDIVDKRHTEEGFHLVEDDYEDIIQSLLSHDVIVFTTPLYWYGMSGQMKTFIDRWSQYLRDERFNFKEEMSKKKAYVVVTGGNKKIVALPLIQQFHYIFDFVNMEFVDYLLGQGNEPMDVKMDEEALSKATYLNNKLKTQLEVI
nr:flavodoxin family protein [Bacillus sp. SM2101]